MVRLFLTLLPLTRRTSIQEQGTAERILEQRVRLRHPLHHGTIGQTDHISRVREAATR